MARAGELRAEGSLGSLLERVSVGVLTSTTWVSLLRLSEEAFFYSRDEPGSCERGVAVAGALEPEASSKRSLYLVDLFTNEEMLDAISIEYKQERETARSSNNHQ